jgi:uncharacterized membrane protein
MGYEKTVGGAVSGGTAGSAFGPWGTAIGAGAGALFGLYSDMTAQDAANQNYEMQMKQFEANQAMQQHQMALSEAAQKNADMYSAGTYSQNLRDDQMNPYLAWYNKVGG